MRKMLILLPLLVLIGACGRIDTNHVGVRTSWNGEVQKQEEEQGFYTAFVSDVEEFSTQEITVELFDMTPKAKDNLTLADLDIEVYYIPTASQVADLQIKYNGKSAYSKRSGVWLPAYELVRSQARDVVYGVVSQYDSLTIHQKRDTLRSLIKDHLQKSLDDTDAGTFKITRVIIRNVKTDPSIEASIKAAVAKNKELEAKKIEEDIASAQVRINDKLTKSLSPQILRQRELEMLEKACGQRESRCVFLQGESKTDIMLPLK